jgi:pimeloyl-ACP methyl ester carboxylesterase
MLESTPSSLPQGDIRLRDGRRLAYAEYGDLKGKPVLFFHATPGSRLFHHPDESVAAAAGARIIVIERPGFGRSDFKPGRKLLEWPDDVLQFADALNLTKFAVLGYSGGGAYAAACASSIPDRLTAIGLVGSIAPMEDVEMTKGMHGIGHIFLSLDRHLSPLAKLGTGVMCSIWRDNPEAYFKSQLDGLRDSEAARAMLPSIKTMLAADIKEAIRCGTEGVTLELKLLSQPWGFQMNVIKPEVLLWHGETDAEAPVAMGKRLARAIPHCRAAFFPGEGHWAIYVHWREILTALLAAAGTRTVSGGVPLQGLTRTPLSISTLSDPSADSGQGLPPASSAAEAPTGTDAAEGKKMTLVEVIESLADAPPEVPADAPVEAVPVAEAPAPVDEAPAPADEAAAPLSEAPTASGDAPVPMAEAPSPETEAASPVAELPAPVQEATEPVTETPPPVEEAPARAARKKAARRGKAAAEPASSVAAEPEPAAETAAPVVEAPAPISRKKGKAAPVKKDRPAPQKGKATGAKGRDSGDARVAKGKTAVPAGKPAKRGAKPAARGASKEAPSAPKHEEPAPKKPASGRRSPREAVHA